MKFLTKSRFKIGYECSKKLSYLDNSNYINSKTTDPFLKALAKGGFQVGALAKLQYENATEVHSKGNDEAVNITNELLKLEHIVIFEGAFTYKNLFIRADIVIKNNNSLELIEVKSKSIDPGEEFFTKKGDIYSGWDPYIADVAFQKWVVKNAHPDLVVTASLQFVDKSKTASVDGLNQKFLIKKSTSNSIVIETKPNLSKSDIDIDLLIKRNVDNEIDYIWSQTYQKDNLKWDKFIQSLSDIYCNGELGEASLSGVCKNCEFRVTHSESKGKKSGFAECWKPLIKDDKDLYQSKFSFDVPRLHYTHRDKMLAEGAYTLAQITDNYLKEKPRDDAKEGLSNSQRQWIFINHGLNKNLKSHLDVEGLARELSTTKIVFPLHFIDFETSRVAIPFNKGRRPYEQIAFQYSHHTIEKDGSVCHVDQYLNAEPGVFPNFDFIRHLKKSLEQDNGTIFRYAAHENTVLSEIREQLLQSNEHDKEDLISFIETIADAPKPKTKKDILKWTAPRPMIDMCDLVRRYYLSPLMNGSASLKKVLPTILTESDFLKKRYSKAIYGGTGIKSLNFTDPMAWINFEPDGSVSDPYKKLPKIFKDYELSDIERLTDDEELRDGAAAMTAYAMMQFSEMSEAERSSLKEALLRYCELDTLAMVMLYEFWSNLIQEN